MLPALLAVAVVDVVAGVAAARELVAFAPPMGTFLAGATTSFLIGAVAVGTGGAGTLEAAGVEVCGGEVAVDDVAFGLSLLSVLVAGVAGGEVCLSLSSVADSFSFSATGFGGSPLNSSSVTIRGLACCSKAWYL